MQAHLVETQKLFRRLQWGFNQTSIAALVASILLVPLAEAAPAIDPEFSAFWTKFKTALQKNDSAAVTDMTQLPYLLDSKKLDRAQFIKKYPTIFTAEVRKCLSKQKPVKDQQSYFLFCGEEIFIFAKVKGRGYAFTEIGVND